MVKRRNRNKILKKVKKVLPMFLVVVAVVLVVLLMTGKIGKKKEGFDDNDDSKAVDDNTPKCDEKCKKYLQYCDPEEEDGYFYINEEKCVDKLREIEKKIAEADVVFYPPSGSTTTRNTDSYVVTLPNATSNSEYNESIEFYATDEITMNIGGRDVALEFVSLQILSLQTPDGMNSTCSPKNCTFGPNAWGEINLNGTVSNPDKYTLDLRAMVTVNLTNVGIPSDLTFPIPYNGENPILNMALGGTDYSSINRFVPTFVLNVETEE